MPRPTKWRKVEVLPPASYFKPAGVPLRDLLEVSIGIEEVEALRLRDVQGLEQEECAETMSISRPTFHRVLASARRKVADALTNGKALRIEGGSFAMASQEFRCASHGHEWRLPFEAVVRGRPLACPRCGSPTVSPVPPFGPGAGRGVPGRGRQRRGRWRGEGG